MAIPVANFNKGSLRTTVGMNCSFLIILCAVYLSMTSDNDCPRLPEDDAVTVPLVVSGQELSQFLLDLRTSQIIQWKSVAIISDYTVGTFTQGVL